MKLFVSAALAASVCAAPVARAHLLACDKTVNGATVTSVDRYPATVTFELRIRNVHPTAASEVLGVEDALLATQFGWTPARPPPYDLALGESHTETVQLAIDTYEDCLVLAKADGFDDSTIENVLRATWDTGETQCRARIVCLPPLTCEDAGADLMTDPANCGACGNSCDDGDSCTVDSCAAGACVHAAMDCSALDSECTAGKCVNGACTTVNRNEDHCCGVAKSGFRCTAGVCTPHVCSAGTELVQGICVPLPETCMVGNCRCGFEEIGGICIPLPQCF